MADSEQNLEEATEDLKQEQESEGLEQQEQSKQEEKPKSNRYSKKIQKLKWEKEETSRQLEAERKRVAELQELTKIKSEPDQNDYEDYNKFKADKDLYLKQQEEENEKRIEAQVVHRLEQQQAAQQQEARTMTWAKQKEYGIKNFEGWNEKEKVVVEYLNEYKAADLRDEILDSEKGAALVDKLGGDTDKLEELLRLPPLKQAKQLGILEKTLDATPVKKGSSAPDPAKGIQPSASVKSNNGQSKYIRKKGESSFDYAKRVNGS